MSETRGGEAEPALGPEQLERLRATLLLQFLMLARGGSPGFPSGVQQQACADPRRPKLRLHSLRLSLKGRRCIICFTTSCSSITCCLSPPSQAQAEQS